MSAKRLKQPKIQGSFQSTSFKIWSASNKPNMPREKYLTNTHKSYPFVFFTPFNPIVYSPIRTRTPFWKGVFLGGNKKKRERTPDFHLTHSIPPSNTNWWAKVEEITEIKAPRASERLYTLRFNEVFTARPMNFECPFVKWCWIKIYKTYTHVI